jgi:hypothetical protein
MKKGTLRRLDALASDGVERATVGGPPTAFRIWRAGDNTTDHGETRFTERSAKLLMEEQARRGNRYSFDINHLSLDKTAPLENQKGVGFFSLQVRDGELWTADCEWAAWVASGLTKDPPEWKFFSPAYDVDAETGEVVSFLNCALTNTPATWGVTALATRRAKGTRMKWSDIKAALEGDDEDAKATAYATIAAAFPDKGDDDKEGGDGEKETKASADDAPDSKKEPKAEKKDAEDPADKKDAKASLVASQDQALATALARIAALEAKDETAERAVVMAGREMTKVLADSLSKLPLATVKSICAGLPVKAKKDLAADAKVTATRGDTQGGPVAQPATDKEAMDVRMGLKRATVSIKHDGRTSTFDVMTAEDAKRHIEAKQAKKGGAK